MPDDTDRPRRPGQTGEVAKGQAALAFDSRAESRWSIPKEVAWIAWRDFDLVSEQDPELRSEHWHPHGLLDSARKPDEPAFPMGLSLEIRDERTIARLVQMDEAFRAKGNLPSTAVMTIPEAVADLWREWGDGLLPATGLNKEGEVVEIPPRELPYLELREEAGKDVLRYRHRRDIDDFAFVKPGFTEIKFPRVDSLRLWPPAPGKLPAMPTNVPNKGGRPREYDHDAMKAFTLQQIETFGMPGEHNKRLPTKEQLVELIMDEWSTKYGQNPSVSLVRQNVNKWLTELDKN